MPRSTAAWRRELNQADRSVPVVVRIAGAGSRSRARSARCFCAGATARWSARPQSRTIEPVLARSLIDHEDGLRRQIVVATPKGADQAGYAARRARGDRGAGQAAAGRLSALRRRRAGAGAAARELLLHSAAAFVLIVLLLALAFGHARHVLLVLLALPSTLIGGVAAVALTGGTLTLGAMVGFVALFGMAARNTILLVSHYDHLVREE